MFYENVKVAVDERWAIVVAMISKIKFMLVECLKLSRQRKIFGKRLFDQPVMQQ